MKELAKTDIFQNQNFSQKLKKESTFLKSKVVKPKPLATNKLVINFDYSLHCSINSLEEDEWVPFAEGTIHLMKNGLFLFIRSQMQMVLLKFKYSCSMFQEVNNIIFFEAKNFRSQEEKKFQILFNKPEDLTNFMNALKKYENTNEQ